MVMSTPLTLHHPILQLFVRFPLRLSRPSLGGDIMISHSQGSFQRDSAGSYRPTQASGFHGWERPNIAGGLSCTAWRSPCFWLLHIGGFRLYTLRRAQPLSMCRHTGAGHSCHHFRLHDRRASLPFSGAVRRSRLPGIVSFHSQLRGLWSGLISWLPQKVRVTKPSAGIEPASTMPNQGIALTIELQGHIAHSRGSGCTAATPSVWRRKRGRKENGSAGEYAPTLPFSHSYCFVLTTCCKNRIFLTI